LGLPAAAAQRTPDEVQSAAQLVDAQAALAGRELRALQQPEVP
jgi:hypothetical protein